MVERRCERSGGLRAPACLPVPPPLPTLNALPPPPRRYYFPNGTLQSSTRVCCIGKLDLEAGLGWSAVGFDGGSCPDEYLPTPAKLIPNEL